MNKDFVFVSHSSRNQQIVLKIVEYLESQNIKCFIAPRDITPGSIYAEEIINAISNCLCCLLVFSDESNSSNYVLKEINSAINHDIYIMPVKIDNTIPSKSFEFYLGTNHWISCLSLEKDINNVVNAVNVLLHKDTIDQKQGTIVNQVKYKGPIVLNYSELEDIGYDAERRVMETIEIDYLTLGEANQDYVINEEIEGSVVDWKEYASDYPETCLGLIVNDKMVGYSQIEMVNEKNYNSIINGSKMIDASMEEFYGFGGDFYCYIAIMPIIKKYENSNNYLLLFNALFKQIIDFNSTGINIIKYGISVYTPLLETIVKTLNFKYIGKNIVGGKIYELDKDSISKCPIYKKRYPDLYRLYGEEND